MENRQIQYLSLIANELLDSRLVSHEGGLMFKLDFYKAFDCVRWDFLDSILEQFGFRRK